MEAKPETIEKKSLSYLVNSRNYNNNNNNNNKTTLEYTRSKELL